MCGEEDGRKICRIDICNPRIQFSKTRTHVLCGYRFTQRPGLLQCAVWLGESSVCGGRPTSGGVHSFIGFAVGLFGSRATVHTDRLTTRHQPNLEEVFKHGLQKSLSHGFGQELRFPKHPLSVRFTSLQIAFFRRGTLPRFSSEGLPGATRSFDRRPIPDAADSRLGFHRRKWDAFSIPALFEAFQVRASSVA